MSKRLQATAMRIVVGLWAIGVIPRRHGKTFDAKGQEVMADVYAKGCADGYVTGYAECSEHADLLTLWPTIRHGDA